MLKLLFYVTLFGLASGQVKKGTKTINGNFYFSSGTETVTSQNETVEHTYSNLGISPTFSYFFIDNLSTGISINYNFTKRNSSLDNYSDYDGNSITIGPEVRYYFDLNPLLPFARVKLGYTFTNNKFDRTVGLGENKYTTSYRFYSFGFGNAFMVSSDVAIELISSYNINILKIDIQPEDFTLSESKDKYFNISVGFNYYL